MEPWELSPEIEKEEETDERARGAAGKEANDRVDTGSRKGKEGKDAADNEGDGDGRRGARAGEWEN